MKYCVRCGRALNVGDQICGGCGMRQPYVEPALLDNRPVTPCFPAAPCPPMPAVTTYALVPVYNRPLLPRHKKGVIPYIVWSLILVPIFNIIGTPLAVIAAMLTLSADAAYDIAESERKLDKAAALCIIATVVDVATLIFLIASTVSGIRG
jgi:hypothetical protein